MMKNKGSLKVRFLKKVNKHGPRVPLLGRCWVWTGSSFTTGYGSFWMFGKLLLATRVAYEIWVGPIPTFKFVLHKCDNPSCVRPSHLYVGTQQDNADDRKARGRGRAHGVEDNLRTRSLNGKRLEARAIKEICDMKLRGISIETLAHRFAVREETIKAALEQLSQRLVE
jgi:hypothetical protein